MFRRITNSTADGLVEVMNTLHVRMNYIVSVYYDAKNGQHVCVYWG